MKTRPVGLMLKDRRTGDGLGDQGGGIGSGAATSAPSGIKEERKNGHKRSNPSIKYQQQNV